MRVACIIPCDKYRRILLCKLNKPGHPKYNHWVFAGGKQEEGETLLDTLHREVKEELNLEIGERKVIHLISLPGNEKGYTLDYYFVEVSDEEKDKMIICDREFSDHKWLTYREFAKLNEPKTGHCDRIMKVLMEPKNAIEVINGHGPKTIDNGDMKEYTCRNNIRNITTLRSQFIQTGPNTFDAYYWECITVLQQLWENPNTAKKKWIDIPTEWKILD